MLVTYWKDHFSWSNCVRLDRLHAQGIQGQKGPWHSPDGFLRIRQFKFSNGSVVHMEVSAPHPVWILLEARQADGQLLLAATQGDARSSCRLEEISSSAIGQQWFVRSSHAAFCMIQMNGTALPFSAPLPVCPTALRLLQRLVESAHEHPPTDIDWYQWLQELVVEMLAPPMLRSTHWQQLQPVARRLFLDSAHREGMKELEQASQMSGTYLKKFFQLAFGQSIHEFQQQYRMQLACRLLMQAVQSIDDVAQSCGYSEASNFIVAFRQYFGVTPGLVFR